MRVLPFLVLLTLAAPAAADVPSPDECGKPGTACKNAYDEQHKRYDAPGRCAESTCTRSAPGPEGASRGAVSYPCGVCKAEPRTKRGGCSVDGSASPGVLGGAGVLLAAAGLLLIRRRR
jgi:MYXO-CTERM domain-containing protein